MEGAISSFTPSCPPPRPPTCPSLIQAFAGARMGALQVRYRQHNVLQVVDAAVTSVSSAAVAAGRHTEDTMERILRDVAAQLGRAITVGSGGCPEPYIMISGLCLSVPSVDLPVPYLPHPIEKDHSYFPAGEDKLSLLNESKPALPTGHSESPDDDIRNLKSTVRAPQTDTYTWLEARALCNSFDGDLAVLHESVDLAKLLWSLRHAADQGFWLGAKITRRSPSSIARTVHGVEENVPIGNDFVYVKTLKWVTGEYSQANFRKEKGRSSRRGVLDYVRSDSNFVRESETRTKDLFGSRMTMHSNEIIDDEIVPTTRRDECLFLANFGNYKLLVEDCREKHRPLCQFIPSLV